MLQVLNARYLAVFVLSLVISSFTTIDVFAGPAGPPGGRRPPPVVAVAPVTKRSVRSRLTVVGTVNSFRTSVVSSEIEGRVKSAPVWEGEPVIEGKTILAALERSDLEFDLRIARAELVKAEQDYLRLKRGSRPEEIEIVRSRFKEREAELRRDELELKRAKDLLSKNVINRSNYDRALTQFQVSKSKHLEEKNNLRLAEIGPRREEIAKAQAEVDRVKARIAHIEDQLSKSVIRSPLTGFMTQKSVEVGQWVAKGGKIGEVIEIRKVLVRAPVSEKHISYVQVGDTSQVRFDAIPGRQFTGRIVRVIPKADLKSRTFPVEVELENSADNIIKAGMFARVTLEYGKATESVLVPKDAVLIRPRGAAVFVFEEGKVREVEFVPGRGVDSSLEVPAGKLKPGMKVVVQGNENLRNGMAVRIRGAGGRRSGAPQGGAGRQKRGAE